MNQALVSGIGNIYVDEVLWAAEKHGETVEPLLSGATISEVIDSAR
ncbi:hypothetical protein [Glutamicibacter sp. BW80]|nr:hypothetical protein [Glutamicibacter sp. BW80]